jgi:hypothetical protein
MTDSLLGTLLRLVYRLNYRQVVEEGEEYTH